MTIVRLLFVALAGLMLAPSAASAADDPGFRHVTKAGTYEDVRDDVRAAIEKRGLVIDYTGHVNSMLERTADVAGSVTTKGAKSPFANAEYMQFCPSALTHEAVSASPFAVANCPMSIFIYELRDKPGVIEVGYRLPVPSPSKIVRGINEKITALMQEIVAEATK